MNSNLLLTPSRFLEMLIDWPAVDVSTFKGFFQTFFVSLTTSGIAVFTASALLFVIIFAIGVRLLRTGYIHGRFFTTFFGLILTLIVPGMLIYIIFMFTAAEERERHVIRRRKRLNKEIEAD